METKKYICLRCSHVIDMYANEELDNAFLIKHYNFIKEEDGVACPGCLHVLRVLKGKKGNPFIPQIDEPGIPVLLDEETKKQADAIEADFQALAKGEKTKGKAWGFTSEDFKERKKRRTEKEAKSKE